MEDKVTALVNEVASIQTTLVAMQQKANDNHEQLLTLLTQGLCKQQLENDEEGSVVNKSSNNKPNNEDGDISSIPGWTKLDRELLDEFCQTTKKVKLSIFNGDDLAKWIAHVEIYFHVMGTSLGVRVNMTHLCMEVSMIHFINSLLHYNPGFTWERFTNELLERYGSANHGDVFEQLSNLQQSLARRINLKLSTRYFGPFKVLERMGVVSYKLWLPKTSRIHLVIHVSLLKKVVEDCQVEKGMQIELDDELIEAAEPHLVLATIKMLQQGETVKQYLVQWQVKFVDEATWEDELTLLNQFLIFNLEDKVVLQDGEIDRTPSNVWAKVPRPKVWRVYTRREKREDISKEGLVGSYWEVNRELCVV